MSRQEPVVPMPKADAGAEAEADDEKEGAADEKTLRQSDQIRDSMQTTAELWARDDKAWPEEPAD
eukprot:16029126-Heterocapsa_arctica.AAC.1